MEGALRLLGLFADPTRLRILRAVERQELSVNELQETLRLGQSRISTHLSQMRRAGVLVDRREGQRVFYRLAPEREEALEALVRLGLAAARELPEAEMDGKALEVVLEKRKELTRQYFNTLAERLGKNYCPGRSWQAVGHLLIGLVPPLVIADLGAGEGLISQMLAARAKRVIAVDNSARMVEVGTALAKANQLRNLEYRLGDLEDPPLAANSVDVVILSQALHHAGDPGRALKASHRILRKGGRVLILDLSEHHFEKARTLYGDVWLGFSEAQLREYLGEAGFGEVTTGIVAKETVAPFFQTVLASGVK
ncbi:MAG: metalloregulator ArsR/SmtB family transcription factor [Verrucomicrobiia bacterium]